MKWLCHALSLKQQLHMRMLLLPRSQPKLDGKTSLLQQDHSQLKGGWAEGRYYDATGQAVINQFIQIRASNQWAYLPRWSQSDRSSKH